MNYLDIIIPFVGGLGMFISGMQIMAQGLENAAGNKMKSLLEPIKELVPGAVEIQVLTEGLSSGNRDVALVSSFETVEALEIYQNHPAHVEAGKYVRSVTCNRACMDYEA